MDLLSKKWLNDINRFNTDFLEFTKWTTDKNKTLDYLTTLQKKYTVATYRKRVYQIRKFLDYLGMDWARQLNPPCEPVNTPIRLTLEDIQNTLAYFKDNKYYTQVKALILLGCTSGMRAEEMYQLRRENIDLEKRMVTINHNPKQGQTTKTGHSRVSYFTDETKQAIVEYLAFLDDNKQLKYLFNFSHMRHLFRTTPMKAKFFRKYFSQIWDRNEG